MSLLKLLFHNQGKGRPIGGSEAVPWYLSGGVPLANCLGAWKAIGAASLATSYINLANPGTYDLTTTHAPSFAAATGWTFPGVNQYLDTGIVPASGYSMMIRYANADDLADAALFGEVDGNNSFYFSPQSEVTKLSYGSGSSPLKVVPKLLTGIVGMAGNKGYRNGIADAGTMGAWASTTTYTCYIGAYNAFSIDWVSYVPASTIQAVAIYNATLTATQMLALYTAMAAL